MIYCGYQGVGKSTYCRNHPNTTIDLDSSAFKKEELWEVAYVNQALALMYSTGKDVFISAHSCVIEQLASLDAPLIILIPGMNKDAWKSRLEFRYYKNPTEPNLKAVYDFIKNFDKDMEFYKECETAGCKVKKVTATVITDIEDFI